MKKAVYPGTFDPVTLGHLDIIERSSKIFDQVIVGILANQSKTPLFTVAERIDMLQRSTSHLDNIEIASFEGLLVDFVKQCDAQVIIRGLRAITDFEYEIQMAHTNRIMAPDLDTLFLTTSLNYAYLSSSTVREVGMLGGNIDIFLPPYAADKVREKYKIAKGEYL